MVQVLSCFCNLELAGNRGASTHYLGSMALIADNHSHVTDVTIYRSVCPHQFRRNSTSRSVRGYYQQAIGRQLSGDMIVVDTVCV